MLASQYPEGSQAIAHNFLEPGACSMLDTEGLNLILSSLIGKDWQTALAIFTAMPELSLEPDAITFSSMISALAKGRQWFAALEVHTLFLLFWSVTSHHELPKHHFPKLAAFSKALTVACSSLARAKNVSFG